MAQQIDLVRLNAVIEQTIGAMPHPDAPSVSVRDYEAHLQVAAMLRGDGGFPEPGQVAAAVHMLKGMEMSPGEFEHAWEMALPTATRLLGRPPRPQEIKALQGLHPGDVWEYYANHPYPGYEEVKAGDMMRYYHAAKPIANQHLGRDPNKVELARFASAGYETEDILRHYSQKQR